MQARETLDVWKSLAVSYDELGDLADVWQWMVVGYVPALVSLKASLCGHLKDKVILDHGCGPGRVTRLLKYCYGADVVGADTTQEMVEQAQSRDAAGRYVHIPASEFPLKTDSFDGIVSNWVWCTMGDLETMAAAARECHRVLKAGASLIILVNDPRVFSHRGQSYAWGEDDREYESGAPLPVRFFGSDGKVTMSFVDTYWSLDDYTSTLRAAGFSLCRHFAPPRPCGEEVAREIHFLQDRGIFPRVAFRDYIGEPTLVIVATKPQPTST